MSWNPYPAPEMLPPATEDVPPQYALKAQETPTLMETVAFFALAALVLLAIQGAGAAVAMHWHLFGKIGFRSLSLKTRFTIPMMVLSYGAGLWAAAALFRRVWSLPFFDGIHWNFPRVRAYWPVLLALGVALGFLVQFASNFLPVPKELPVDAFFRTPFDAWMVALFGIFIAPIAEEIAFRGFLYPSLRRWTGPLVAAILTSLPFAFLHAEQVAKAWGPLAIVCLVSIVLCAVRDRTGSVAASAMVHACYNFSIFAVMFYASGGFVHLDRLKD
ncbi:MAG: CPBP family intramembrane glutamic endopeptidase [Acidobacteriaceae bacterium]